MIEVEVYTDEIDLKISTIIMVDFNNLFVNFLFLFLLLKLITLAIIFFVNFNTMIKNIFLKLFDYKNVWLCSFVKRLMNFDTQHKTATKKYLSVLKTV